MPERSERLRGSPGGLLVGPCDMKPVDTSDELEALTKLREHERELDQQLEDARQEAAQRLAGARQAAEQLKQEAEAELSAHVMELRQQAACELEHAVSAVRAETTRRSQALHEAAVRNRDRALAFVLSRVTGSDGP